MHVTRSRELRRLRRLLRRIYPFVIDAPESVQEALDREVLRLAVLYHRERALRRG